MNGASYCPRHNPEPRRKRVTPGRGSTAPGFRKAVLGRAGGRCQFVSAEGVRCTATQGLEAHHLRPLWAGGANEPGNGAALCRRHHRIAERMTNRALDKAG